MAETDSPTPPENTPFLLRQSPASAPPSSPPPEVAEFAPIPWTFFAMVLYLIGILSLLGGIKLGSDLWPSDSRVDPVAYQPAIIMFTVGVVQAALLTAVGLALTYLERIEINTRKK